MAGGLRRLPPEPPGTADRPSRSSHPIDALRADAVGVFAARRALTPALDALARERPGRARRWRRRAGRCRRWPRCSPASTLAQQNWHGDAAMLRPELVTPAEALKQRGYATTASTHQRLAAAAFGYGAGFDTSATSARASAPRRCGPPRVSRPRHRRSRPRRPRQRGRRHPRSRRGRFRRAPAPALRVGDILPPHAPTCAATRCPAAGAAPPAAAAPRPGTRPRALVRPGAAAAGVAGAHLPLRLPAQRRLATAVGGWSRPCGAADAGTRRCCGHLRPRRGVQGVRADRARRQPLRPCSRCRC